MVLPDCSAPPPFSFVARLRSFAGCDGTRNAPAALVRPDRGMKERLPRTAENPSGVQLRLTPSVKRFTPRVSGICIPLRFFLPNLEPPPIADIPLRKGMFLSQRLFMRWHARCGSYVCGLPGRPCLLLTFCQSCIFSLSGMAFGTYLALKASVSGWPTAASADK